MNNKPTLLLEFDSPDNFKTKCFALILNSGRSIYSRVRDAKRVKMILENPYCQIPIVTINYILL